MKDEAKAGVHNTRWAKQLVGRLLTPVELETVAGGGGSCGGGGSHAMGSGSNFTQVGGTFNQNSGGSYNMNCRYAGPE